MAFAVDPFPTEHGIGLTGAEPRWRAKLERLALTWDDLFRAYDAIIDRTLKVAGVSCVRLCQVMDRIRTWYRNSAACRKSSRRSKGRTPNPNERQTLWLEIRDFIGHNRTYNFMKRLPSFKPFEDVFESGYIRQHSGSTCMALR